MQDKYSIIKTNEGSLASINNNDGSLIWKNNIEYLKDVSTIEINDSVLILTLENSSIKTWSAASGKLISEHQISTSTIFPYPHEISKFVDSYYILNANILYKYHIDGNMIKMCDFNSIDVNKYISNGGKNKINSKFVAAHISIDLDNASPNFARIVVGCILLGETNEDELKCYQPAIIVIDMKSFSVSRIEIFKPFSHVVHLSGIKANIEIDADKPYRMQDYIFTNSFELVAESWKQRLDMIFLSSFSSELKSSSLLLDKEEELITSLDNQYKIFLYQESVEKVVPAYILCPKSTKKFPRQTQCSSYYLSLSLSLSSNAIVSRQKLIQCNDPNSLIQLNFNSRNHKLVDIITCSTVKSDRIVIESLVSNMKYLTSSLDLSSLGITSKGLKSVFSNVVPKDNSIKHHISTNEGYSIYALSLNENENGNGDVKDNKTIQISWHQDESTSNIVEMEFIGNSHSGSLSNLEHIPTFNTRLAMQYNDILV